MITLSLVSPKTAPASRAPTPLQSHPAARFFPAVVAAACLACSSAEAAIFTYYIGVDKLPTLATGIYAGQANPNHNRLTFLLSHVYPVVPAIPGDLDASVNHFHSLGSYRLSGPASAPTVTFANARVPEGARPALPLQDGSGVYAGKLASSVIADPVIGEYSHLQISPLSQLRAFHENAIPNEPEDYMYFGFTNPNPALSTASSNQRFSTTNLGSSDVHFELVSLTAGLNIGRGSNMNIMTNPGDEYHLGDGDSFGLFEPTFWTDAGAAPGTYAAKFKLTDESGLFEDSGEFRFEFVVVPEPGSLALIGLSGLVLTQRRRARTV